MDNVIPFPTRAVRNWEEVRQVIDDMLIEAGLPREGIAIVTERVRQAWLSYDREYSIAIDLPLPTIVSPQQRHDIVEAVRAGFAALQSEMQATMNRVLVDRLKLELELYLAREQPRYG